MRKHRESMITRTRLVIAIDCDDVIVETSPAIIAYYNNAYGTHLELKDIYSDDPTVWGTNSDKEAITRVETYLKTDEYQKTAPSETTIASIKRLARQHELHVVTGRSDLLEAATTTMLELYFPGIFASIEHTGMYGGRPRSKGDVCVEIGADLLIDDHIRHAEQVASRDIHVLLFGNYPWNQTKVLPKHTRRVQDWAEVERIVL